MKNSTNLAKKSKISIYNVVVQEESSRPMERQGNLIPSKSNLNQGNLLHLLSKIAGKIGLADWTVKKKKED